MTPLDMNSNPTTANPQEFAPIFNLAARDLIPFLVGCFILLLILITTIRALRGRKWLVDFWLRVAAYAFARSRAIEFQIILEGDKYREFTATGRVESALEPVKLPDSILDNCPHGYQIGTWCAICQTTYPN